MSSEKLTKKQNILQVVKFVLFSASAAIIQTAVFALLNDVVRLQGWFLTYFPALVASVLWNFTFNRKYTFKSAANVPVAMLKVALFYCLFTMIINLVTEFLYCRFFVYRNNMNNNDVAEKERQKQNGQDSL